MAEPPRLPRLPRLPGPQSALRVLVVEDAAELRLLLGMQLELAGHRVVAEAPDAATARERAAALRPDAVVLDQELPDGTGTDLLPELRAQLPGLRAVLFSGNPATAALAEAAGADGFLVKGAPLEQLVALLAPPARSG